MFDKRLVLDEINRVGRPLRDGVRSLVAERNPKVVALGESEFLATPFRQISSEIIAELQSAGFTHLCLEIRTDVQPELDDFGNTGNIQALQKKLFELRYRFFELDEASGHFDAPDKTYFGILATAQALGMQLIAIDEPRKNDVHTYRDETMASNVERVLEKAARAIVWGGFKHHYRRQAQQQGKYRTLLELLESSVGGEHLVSILGHVEKDAMFLGSDAVTSLLPSLTDPLLVVTADAPALAGIMVSEESRCHYGTCKRMTFDGELVPCRESSKNTDLCPDDPLSSIRYADWTALALVPGPTPVQNE